MRVIDVLDVSQARSTVGLERAAGFAAVDDALIGQVVQAVRPVRPNGRGAAWDLLLGHEEQVRAWVAGDGKDAKPLSIMKIEELLARQGVAVPYRTLHRFATQRWAAGSRRPPCGWPTASRAWSCRSTSGTRAT